MPIVLTSTNAQDFLSFFHPDCGDHHMQAYREHRWLEVQKISNAESWTSVTACLADMKAQHRARRAA